MLIQFINAFSLKNLVGLSLILSANYYFFTRKFFFLNLEKNIVQTLILFFFSLFFFYLISKLFKILKNKFKKIEFLKLLLIYFFFTWLLVLSIKTIFYVSNYISLPELISKIFSLEFTSEYQFIKRIIIFLVPYITSFFFIFIYRNKLLKFLNFFVILGYILFILLCYDFAQKSFFNQLSKPPIVSLKDKKEKIQKNQKVIWIIFDEFDPEIAFSNFKNVTFMPIFKEFKKNSLTHLKMFPPANETLMSMPAQLVGTETVGTEIKNNNFMIRIDNNASVKFSYENTIFGRLAKEGFNSSILSSTLPYCTMLLKVKKCVQPNEELYKGIVFVFPLLSKIELFFKLLDQDKNKIHDINLIQNTKAIQDIDAIRYVDGQKTISFDLLEEFINSPSNLIFIHVMLPHLPANMGFGDPSNYAEKIFNIKVGEGLPSYILNLKMTDIVLKKILNILYKINKEDKMLILSSDHGYRLKDQIDAQRVLFIAKILSENNKIEISEPDSAIYIQELIYKYLLKEISTYSDIKKFFEEKPFHKTYISQ